MFYLHMHPSHFGMEGHHESVRAPYETLEHAKAQADHNIKIGSQLPLRIQDEAGKVVVDYPSKK